MKSIFGGAKQQLSSCMQQDSDDTPPVILVANNDYNHHQHENHYQQHNGGFQAPTRRNHSPRHYSQPHTELNDHTASEHNNNNNVNSNFITAVTTPITGTSTYETLQRPFKHDRRRGQWSATADFYFACTSHAFGSIIFSEVPVYAMIFGGVFFLPMYLIAIFLYAIPIFIIQTFLGQFSTSGLISAFRVAPLFKGIGYSILLLNLISLAYYGIVAAVPLIYAANAVHTVIPWMSCDNAWNTPNCSTHSTYDADEISLDPHATVEFFRYIILTDDNTPHEYVISWPVLCGVVGVWLLALGILLKRVSFIGKFFRCICIIMFAIFLAIFLHLICYIRLDWDTFVDYFKPTLQSSFSGVLGGLRTAIFMSTWLLGPGWGNVLTLASHNRFHRDSEKLTYWVSGTHVLLAFMAMISGRIAFDHFEDHVGFLHFHFDEEHYMQFLYLCFAYLFGSFTSLPNFWCFLFFTMIFLAELSAIIIQMMSVLTALFDEYEQLRTKKSRITIALTLLMMTVSIYFCTKKGFEHLDLLPNIVILSHLIISFVLLLMTTWIYGRERFQCDLQFMLGKTISSFKIFLIRFLTPAFFVLSIIQTLYFLERDNSPTALVIVSQCVIYAIAPAYMIYKICQTNGTLRNRLKQCFAPHDWHPVDADNRRFYEEIMGVSEMLVMEGGEENCAVNA
ncbi:PREDICTED: sodium- and chloride-dependent glycine transporter 1 [Bactrocera latifrons]|uniref:Sodium-and chloride-dependent glycine transporter 1 n=2 Tax=Bactrocera latifrons TaxID=174628 RepID=A0A0K8WMF0_BACLA|nr:PREDICTED: sodium- and chloride-dependent glycine transporter 1 [Bactrocera latifrons]